jgi:aspartate aminotransferase
MKSPVPTITALRENAIMAIAALARQRPDCIRLELGEPDFTTPEHIRRAAIDALHEPIRYGPGAGQPSLRAAVAAKIARINGYAVTPEQVVITTGGTGALFAALATIAGSGDEVLIPDPNWPVYPNMLACIGARPLYYPLRAERGWLPDPAELAALITPRTRALLINTPANPSGAVFPRELIAALLDLCQRADLYLVTDEAYDEMVYDGEHVSPAALANGDPRVISCYTFSKTYAMTGWRIGYAVAAPELASGITRVVEAYCTNISTIVQRAAEAALTGPQDCVAAMRTAYRGRRDLALALLRQRDVLAHKPGGAFYLLVDISRAGVPVDYFAQRLLEKHNVAVAPGTAFGAAAAQYVRISLASSADELRAGLPRLCEALAQPTMP